MHSPESRTISGQLAAVAAERPAAPALSVGERTWTYAELDAAATRAARALAAAGLRPGDRVAVLARNTLEHVALHYAAWRARVIMLPLNWRLSAQEVAGIFADADPALVMADAEWAPLLQDVRPLPPVVWLDRPPAPQDGYDGPAGTAFEPWLQAGEASRWQDDVDRRPVDPGAVGLLLYTSGSTGLPKGVMINEASMVRMLAQAVELYHVGPDTRYLTIMPLFHIGGVGSIMPTQSVGGHVVVPTDSALTTRMIVTHRATHAAMVPTLLSELVYESRGQDFSSLRYVFYGAAPSGGTLVSDAMALLPGCSFAEAYGATETCGSVTRTALRRLGEPLDHWGSVGPVMAGFELRILDPRTMAEREPGGDGEVWVRGAQLAMGYWRRPTATAEAFLPDGWYRTGDIGMLDGDGHLYLRDRLKDMIISGGENVYSAEVENALLTHPEVREAAAYGIPHPHWGETVKAVVARTRDSELTAEELIAYTRDRLAHFKCPSQIEFMAELPRTGSGKIVKHGLRARDRAAAEASETAASIPAPRTSASPASVLR